ncbi:S1 family peptidase [Ancylobacter terrae]|uniref:S1 family peptidase n=1 Tax=Ancylobacter sp. sgz301288 TaxID=3342077 RepID=UPI00385ACD03
MRTALLALAAAMSLAACVPSDVRHMRDEPAIAIGAPAVEAAAQPASIAQRAGFSIKLETYGGQGSGVHIGDGYVLTAAHVALAGRPVIAKLDNGGRQRTSVVWRNDAYDIALLRIEDFSGVAAVRLSCKTAPVGTNMTAYGSRLAADFVVEPVKVVGQPRQLDRWARVMTVRGDVTKGMSGGGVVQGGRLLGVAVAISETTYQSGRVLPNGYAYVVPASTICSLNGNS